MEAKAVKLRDALKEKLYIPKIQRDYSWDQQQVDDLLDDLFEFVHNKNDDLTIYDLHTINVVKDDEPKKPKNKGTLLIDGQQRMVTLKILMSTIRDLLLIKQKEAEDAGDTALAAQYIALVSNVQGMLTGKGAANGYLDSRYEATSTALKYIVKKPEDRGKLKKGNKRNIHTKYPEVIRARVLKEIPILMALPDISTELEAYDYMVNTILEDCHLVRTKYENMSEAVVSFGSVNSRGKGLAASDLIRYYCLKEAVDTAHEDDFEKFWDDVEKDLNANAVVDLCLRYTEMVLRQSVSGRKVAEKFRKEIIKEPKFDLGDILEELKTFFALYAKVVKGNALGKKYDRQISDIDSLKLKQIRTLLMTIAYEDFDEATAQKILGMIIATHIRHCTINGGNPNVFTDVFSKLHPMITNGEAPAVVLAQAETLIKKIIDENNVYSDIDDTKLTDMTTKTAKFFLKRTEPNVKKTGLMFDDKATLEHIMPQNPASGSQWETDFDADEHAEYLNDLGNLCILHESPNASVQNKDFDEKIKEKCYKDSPIELTKQVSTYPKWTADEIEARRKELADLIGSTFPLKLATVAPTVAPAVAPATPSIAATCPMCAIEATEINVEAIFGLRKMKSGKQVPQSYCRMCRAIHGKMMREVNSEEE
jgi:hypothetical protein